MTTFVGMLYLSHHTGSSDVSGCLHISPLGRQINVSISLANGECGVSMAPYIGFTTPLLDKFRATPRSRPQHDNNVLTASRLNCIKFSKESLCLFVCSSSAVSFCLSAVFPLSLCLFVCSFFSVSLSVCLQFFLCLSVCLSAVFPLSLCLFVCSSSAVSFCLSAVPPLSLSVCLQFFLCLSVCLSSVPSPSLYLFVFSSSSVSLSVSLQFLPFLSICLSAVPTLSLYLSV